MLEVVELDNIQEPIYESEANVPDLFIINDIEIDGNRYYNNWAVKHALKPVRKILKTNDGLIDYDTLDAKLSEINKFSPFKIQGRIAKVSDENNTGADESLLHIDVYEQQPWQVTLTADNQGRPGIGQYRWGTQITNDSLFGYGDKFSAQYVGSARATMAAAAYTLPPFNSRGGNLSLKYYFHHANYDMKITGNNNAPNINAAAHIGKILYVQPIDRQRRFQAYGQLAYARLNTWRNSRTTYNGDYWLATLGAKMALKDKLGATNANVYAIYGGATDLTRQQYLLTRGMLKRTFNLPYKNKLIFRGTYQLTNDFIPIGLDIQSGGAYSVRGYSEGLLNGDRGYVINLEHHWPIPFLSKASPWLAERVHGVTFADFGQTWYDKSNSRYIAGVTQDSNRTILASAGVGFRARLTRFLQGFVDLGYGFYDRNNIELLGQPTVRAHFGIRSDLLIQNGCNKHSDHQERIFHRENPLLSSL